MSLFLISFLSLYGGMHAYAFVRLNGAFSPEKTLTTALAAWMSLMTVAPLLVRMAEGAGLERTARWLAWPSYIWMGSIFIFCSALAAADTLRLAAWLSNRIFTTAVPGLLNATITSPSSRAVKFFGFHDGDGSRFWDADSGDDCEDSTGLFCPGEADQGDLPRVSGVAEGRAQGDPVTGDRVSVRARSPAAPRSTPCRAARAGARAIQAGPRRTAASGRGLRSSGGRHRCASRD